jgi:predicted ArsR family transcriptional regulator
MLDLITLVSANGPPPADDAALAPEQLAIMEVCRRQTSVADIAGRLDLPTDAVRKLLEDLIGRGLVTVENPVPDMGTYKAVIEGLREL